MKNYQYYIHIEIKRVVEEWLFTFNCYILVQAPTKFTKAPAAQCESNIFDDGDFGDSYIHRKYVKYQFGNRW